MHSSWRNSLVDRSKKHSGSYGLRGIGHWTGVPVPRSTWMCENGRNVKPDAAQNRIGQTVTARNNPKHLYLPDSAINLSFFIRLGEMFGLAKFYSVPQNFKKRPAVTVGHIKVKAVAGSCCSGAQYVYACHIRLYQLVVAKYIGVQIDRAQP